MSRPLPTGKLPPELLRSLLGSGPSLPAEIRIGPAVGEDACAIDLPSGTLVAATDPITLTGSGVGAHAVVINANDVAVMGVRPRWFLAAVMLPVGTTEAEVRALFASTREALAEVGASLVGGHTEITAAVVRPVVVGQMLGLAEDGHVVATGGARPGDAIVQVGPAPIEAASVLAAEAADRLRDVDAALLERARESVNDPGVSVVEAALAATALGATALHDPTEGGLATGLQELASASGLQIRMDAAPRWFEPGRVVCERLGADPWGALASGCLLAAFPGESAASACRELHSRGFDAHALGFAAQGSGVDDADGHPLPTFARDEVARVLAD
jgi:hydrogenase maturation factor